VGAGGCVARVSVAVALAGPARVPRGFCSPEVAVDALVAALARRVVCAAHAHGPAPAVQAQRRVAVAEVGARDAPTVVDRAADEMRTTPLALSTLNTRKQGFQSENAV